MDTVQQAQFKFAASFLMPGDLDPARMDAKLQIFENCRKHFFEWLEQLSPEDMAELKARDAKWIADPINRLAAACLWETEADFRKLSEDWAQYVLHAGPRSIPKLRAILEVLICIADGGKPSLEDLALLPLAPETPEQAAAALGVFGGKDAAREWRNRMHSANKEKEGHRIVRPLCRACNRLFSRKTSGKSGNVCPKCRKKNWQAALREEDRRGTPIE
jgi:hypothetical protein